MRGEKKCACETPDWRVKGQALNLSANAERMRQQQDSHRLWLTECYRILRPGGVIKAFCGTRTFHRMVSAMTEVGFAGVKLEAWTYGSGFPKSLNISKAIDRAAGAEREVVGTKRGVGGENMNDIVHGREVRTHEDKGGKGVGAYGTGAKQVAIDVPITAPATEDARKWESWGTALKPSWEPVLIGWKPQ
jgi:site-specific DNA-methyltransferase (adenine-specific)